MIVNATSGERVDIPRVAARANVRVLDNSSIEVAARPGDFVSLSTLRGREFVFREASWLVSDWRADGGVVSFTARKING